MRAGAPPKPSPRARPRCSWTKSTRTNAPTPRCRRPRKSPRAANVAKTRYIAGISHEIRTPLNSIYGYAQLLERGAAGPSDNAIRVIRRSAEHLADLIDGILDISKIENGILRLNRDKVPLAEFLDQIVDMFRLQAAAKGIEFVYQRPPNLPAYRARRSEAPAADPHQPAVERHQVHRARQRHADRALPQPGGGVRDRGYRRRHPRRMSSNACSSRSSAARAPNVRAIPGTGLGLTITKLLTQIMGGEINAVSTEGAGTTFTVRLLLSEAAPAPSSDRRASQGARAVTGYAGTRRKLLLIDDDASHIDIVRNLLQPLDFVLFTAADGAERTRARRGAPAGSRDGRSLHAGHDGLGGGGTPARAARPRGPARS